jgi:hypothetical protein
LCKHDLDERDCDYCNPLKVTVKKSSKGTIKFQWVSIVSGGAPGLGRRR